MHKKGTCWLDMHMDSGFLSVPVGQGNLLLLLLRIYAIMKVRVM